MEAFAFHSGFWAILLAGLEDRQPDEFNHLGETRHPGGIGEAVAKEIGEV